MDILKFTEKCPYVYNTRFFTERQVLRNNSKYIDRILLCWGNCKPHSATTVCVARVPYPCPLSFSSVGSPLCPIPVET